MIEHHKTRGTVVFGIQYALWGDEGNQPTIPYRIKSLDKEVVVYASGNKCPHAFHGCIRRIKYDNIAKRNIWDGEVEVVIERLFYLLESLYAHFLLRVQMA